MDSAEVAKRKVAAIPARRGAATRFRRAVVAALAGGLVLLTGCGLAGNPQPPTLWLPSPVTDLTAVRVGDAVHLHWTMPKNTTDRVALRGDQKGHVCWEFAPGRTGAAPSFDAGACRAAGEGMFAPGKVADLTAPLPAGLTTGTQRAVLFYVELQNQAGKTAGPSNAAWIASGAAPPGVTELRPEASADGVVLHWTPSGPHAPTIMRIHRTLVKTAGAPKPDSSQGAPPPPQQTLEVALNGSDPGGAMDRDAALDHTWKYWAERVVTVQVDGHALEIAGPPSESVTLDAKDVFPPAVPAGLAVVADAQGKAMDLSWTPDTNADIAGYRVYRRDLTAGGTVERITSKLLVPPSCSDTSVEAGHRYAYAVSAVDQDGNESARSTEVEGELPE